MFLKKNEESQNSLELIYLPRFQAVADAAIVTNTLLLFDMLSIE